MPKNELWELILLDFLLPSLTDWNYDKQNQCVFSTPILILPIRWVFKGLSTLWNDDLHFWAILSWVTLTLQAAGLCKYCDVSNTKLQRSFHCSCGIPITQFESSDLFSNLSQIYLQICSIRLQMATCLWDLWDLHVYCIIVKFCFECYSLNTWIDH